MIDPHIRKTYHPKHYPTDRSRIEIIFQEAKKGQHKHVASFALVNHLDIGYSEVKIHSWLDEAGACRDKIVLRPLGEGQRVQSGGMQPTVTLTNLSTRCTHPICTWKPASNLGKRSIL